MSGPEVATSAGLGARTSIRRRGAVGRVARLVFLWGFAIVVVGLPLYLAVLTASKPSAEARSVNMALPKSFALFDNIRTVIDEGNAAQGFINSLIITVPAVTLLLFFGSMASWVFARGRTRSIRALYYVAISGVMLPPAIVSTLQVLSALGLSGSRVGLILFYTGTQLSIAIFLMTGFVKGIPFEIEEAARLDGAGTLRVYFSVIVPSLRPVLLTTGVVLSLFIWNDFLTPFFLLPSAQEQTMPLGLYNFASANAYELNWNLIFTQVLLVSLPLLVVFVAAQKRIIGGLLGGALK